MSENLMIALLSLLGTLGGSFMGILTSGKLTNYRLTSLENKMEGLSDLIERTYALEKSDTLSKEKMKNLEARLQTIESAVHH